MWQLSSLSTRLPQPNLSISFACFRTSSPNPKLGVPSNLYRIMLNTTIYVIFFQHNLVFSIGLSEGPHYTFFSSNMITGSHTLIEKRREGERCWWQIRDKPNPKYNISIHERAILYKVSNFLFNTIIRHKCVRKNYVHENIYNITITLSYEHDNIR